MSCFFLFVVGNLILNLPLGKDLPQVDTLLD